MTRPLDPWGCVCQQPAGVPVSRNEQRCCAWQGREHTARLTPWCGRCGCASRRSWCWRQGGQAHTCAFCGARCGARLHTGGRGWGRAVQEREVSEPAAVSAPSERRPHVPAVPTPSQPHVGCSLPSRRGCFGLAPRARHRRRRAAVWGAAQAPVSRGTSGRRKPAPQPGTLATAALPRCWAEAGARKARVAKLRPRNVPVDRRLCWLSRLRPLQHEAHGHGQRVGLGTASWSPEEALLPRAPYRGLADPALAGSPGVAAGKTARRAAFRAARPPPLAGPAPPRPRPLGELAGPKAAPGPRPELELSSSCIPLPPEAQEGEDALPLPTMPARAGRRGRREAAVPNATRQPGQLATPAECWRAARRPRLELLG